MLSQSQTLTPSTWLPPGCLPVPASKPSEAGAFGNSIAAYFGLEQAPAILATTPDDTLRLAVTRLYCHTSVQRKHAPIQPQSAISIIIAQPRPEGHDRWTAAMIANGQADVSIVDLERDVPARLKPPFDCLQLYIPVAVLQAAARQNGYDKIDPHLLPGLTSDPILQALAMSFVPLFDNPERIAVATVDYLAQAIISHFVVVSQRQSINNKPVPGGLAPWQERRAKDFLMARLGGHVELAELAAHCRLSITHFTRSFRKSTGLPPYCWLIERRVDRARNLLLTSGLSLVEIALACGFGDQSHLTRAFKRSVGTSPGAWRRARTRPGDQATI